MQHLVEQAAYRLIAVLGRHSVLDDGQTDPLADAAPLLAGLTAASIQGRAATGERAGRRLRRLLSDPAEGLRTAPLCVTARSFSLHATTTVAAHVKRPSRFAHLGGTQFRAPLVTGVGPSLLDGVRNTFRSVSLSMARDWRSPPAAAMALQASDRRLRPAAILLEI